MFNLADKENRNLRNEVLRSLTVCVHFTHDILEEFTRFLILFFIFNLELSDSP